MAKVARPANSPGSFPPNQGAARTSETGAAANSSMRLAASLVGLCLSACSALIIDARVPARACHQQRGQTVPIAMIADPVQAIDAVDAVAQLPVDAVVQSTSDPSSTAALATLLFGGAAVILISTAVEGMLGALGLGGGAEAAASAAVRMTAEAAAGGADVAVGASVADVAAALEASAVADIGVAGGAQMGEAVAAIGGAQAAEVVTQAAGVTDVLVDGVAATSLAAVADVVGTGMVGFAGLAAFNGLAPVGEGLRYLAALVVAAWVGSLLRVAVDSIRGAVGSVQSVGAAIESARAEAMRVDAMSWAKRIADGQAAAAMINDLRELEEELAGWAGGSKDAQAAAAMDADLQASTATPVDAMGPFDEGATPDDTDDVGAHYKP